MTAKTTPRVELVKPPKDAKGYWPGDRMIMVDGVQWGRTHTQHHGPRGNSYQFEQTNGNRLFSDQHGKDRDSYPIEVHPRGATKSPEAIIARVRELMAAGKLRHPDIVKHERDNAVEASRNARAEIEAERKAAFRQRAEACLTATPADLLAASGTKEATIAKIIDAMEWAQSQ